MTVGSVSHLRAYIELTRLSNAPTVISNALVGVAIALRSSHELDPAPGVQVAALLAGMILFYIAGMAFNDVMDARIDAHERPSRPIPSQRVSRRSALILAVLTMLLGVAIVSLISRDALCFALGLAIVIVAYDVMHKKYAWSVALMGSCRGLVYLTVAAALAWPLDWLVAAPFAAAITLYIVVLTSIARVEAHAENTVRGRLSLLLPIIMFAPAAVVKPVAGDPWTLACALAVLVWFAQSIRHVRANPPCIKAAVHSWLSGICLMDALYLSLLEQPLFVVIAVVCFVATVLAHRFVPGT